MGDSFDAVRYSPLCAELSDADFAPMRSLCRDIELEPGQILCSPGDKVQSAFILAQGTIVGVVLDGQYEESQAGTILLPGALLNPRRTSQTLVAGTHSSLLELPREGFEELISGNRPVARTLLNEIARQLVSLVRALNRTLSDLVEEVTLTGDDLS